MKKRKFKKPLACYFGQHQWIPMTTIVDKGEPVRERYCSRLGCDAIQIKDNEGKWHRSQFRKP